jgi:transcriptional regulator with XRE-family HTH domain
MDEIDKKAMGRRIRQIRLAAGLRQWELARRLGTTQSAVHKYERGVFPEPRRLVEIARVGETTIEWILTGRHWEHGADTRERLPGPVLDLARRIHEVGDRERGAIEEALRIVRDAITALGAATPAPSNAAAPALEAHGADTLRLLDAAWRIQSALLRQMAEDTARRLAASRIGSGD